MAETTWDAVDAFFGGLLTPEDDALAAAQQNSAAAGLPEISVTPNQGALLAILARSIGARRILEIGTLGGYSTIWLARALPSGGHLISLEIDPNHARVAQDNIAAAGLSDVAEVRLGGALDLLPAIAEEKEGPFDLFFIDADKASIPHYFEWAVKLARRGSLIIVDNVVRGGRVTDASSRDANIRGVRTLAERLANDRRVQATAIQTVGAKGYDGMLLAAVL